MSKGIWSITLPLDPGQLAVYLVQGSSLVLIDTGYLYNLPALESALRSLSFRFADIDLVLMTHGHADHIGACAEVAGQSAQALLHSGDLPLTDGVEAHLSSTVDLIPTLRALGRWTEAAHRTDFLESSVGAPVSGVQTVSDGDLFDLGDGRHLDVVHTPGHTPGSIVLVSAADRIAFVGDAVQGWGTRPGVLPLYFDPASYEKSLRRVAALDVNTLALAHPYRGSLSGTRGSTLLSGWSVPRMICDSLAYVEAARSAVTVAHKEGCTSPLALVERALSLLGKQYWGGGSDWASASAAALLAHAEESHE